MKIIVACDHGGLEFKNELLSELKKWGHQVEDVGTYTKDSCDYPDFAIRAAESVRERKSDRAILICTNGIGMSMVANKIPTIRAAMVYSERTAATTRIHHDSNVLCLGAQEFTQAELFSFTRIWLDTAFENGERHARRISKFPC